MAAGDLENIIPAPNAKLTRNINITDVNGVLCSVKEVYYSDNNAQSHLVWKRDHTPPVTYEYTDVFSSGQIIFKYVATSSSINKIKIWCKNNGNPWNWMQGVYDIDGNKIDFSSVQPSLSTDTLKVDGVDTVVNTYEVNVNFSVTSGQTYYVFASQGYGTHWYPLVYKDTNGDYWQFTGQDHELSVNSIAGKYTAYNDHLIKAEVNGEQV